MKDAFIIGLAQACAVMPGLSRSGSTIATGLLLGNNKAKLCLLYTSPIERRYLSCDCNTYRGRELAIFRGNQEISDKESEGRKGLHPTQSGLSTLQV